MQRFILQENIKRFQARLDELSNADERRRIGLMLIAVERELALLDASEAGVFPILPGPAVVASDIAARTTAIERFREEFGDAVQIAALLDPAPGLTYVEVNRAYVESLGVSRDDLIGRPLFQLFPDNPDDPAADGIYNVYMSLRRVAETSKRHVLPLQRYDVAGEDGVFIQRHWRIANSPVTDDGGRLVLLLNTAEEVGPDAAY